MKHHIVKSVLAEHEDSRPPLTLKGLLVDLDDTLHDKAAATRRVAENQYTSAHLASRGISQPEWVASYVALNDLRIEKAEVFARVGQEFGLQSALVAQLLDDFDSNFGKFVHPLPGAIELLIEARAVGLKVGVVTNGRDAFQRSKIAGLGLWPHIDCVVTSGAFGRKKPDPAIFMECLRILGVAATEAAFVGDDLRADVEPAANLGMRAIWRSAKTSPLAAFCSPNFHEIRAFLFEGP